MTRSMLDPVLLDAMVLGMDVDEEESAWEALIMTPSGTRDWCDAVARRERLDQAATWVQAHPWLARAWLVIKSSGRQVRKLPKVRPVAQLEPAYDLMTAMLSPSVESASRALELQWGAVLEFPLRPGEVVEVSMPAALTANAVHYRTSTDSGILESRRWRLDPGDAPVLLELSVRLPVERNAVPAEESPQAIAAAAATEVSLTAGVLLVEAHYDGAAR